MPPARMYRPPVTTSMRRTDLVAALKGVSWCDALPQGMKDPTAHHVGGFWQRRRNVIAHSPRFRTTSRAPCGMYASRPLPSCANSMP